LADNQEHTRKPSTNSSTNPNRDGLICEHHILLAFLIGVIAGRVSYTRLNKMQRK
jgi:hypothetical protein